MILYLIKSTLCLFLLWSFYKLFLEQEKIHHLKRFYLLFSLIFAYTIPLISVTYDADPIVVTEEVQQPIGNVVTVTELPDKVSKPIDYTSLLWYVYVVGVLVFAIRFVKNIYQLIGRVKSNQTIKETSHTNVLLSDSIVPHTFLKYIFVPRKEFERSSIPEEIWLHEKTHVQQKHTFDILLVEIFQLLFWFNPMWFWVKKSIRLNHEFLADQTVLKQQSSIHQYMDLLVTYPSSTNQTVLTSPINYSLTKKRIVMMSQQFSKTRAAARLLLLLPILFGCFVLFTNKIAAQEKTTTIHDKVVSTDPDKKINIKIVKEKISVNNKSVELSNLTNMIDEATKQWQDNELTEFNFKVKLQNTSSDFLEKVNEEYRKTRLYKANPDGHALVPPPPPVAPKVKEVRTVSAPPAPITPSTSKVNRRTPPLPSPPAPPSNQTIIEYIDEEEIEQEVEQAMQEAEEALHEVEEEREFAIHEAEEAIAENMRHAEEAREIALTKAHRAMERAHRTRERAMRKAERSRHEAHERVLKHSEEARGRAEAAMLRAERERKHSHHISEEARVQVEKARIEAEKHRKMAMAEAQKHREIAMVEAQKVRIEVQKIRKEAMEEAQKALNNAKKEMAKAQKEARKALQKAKKEQLKAQRKAEKGN